MNERLDNDIFRISSTLFPMILIGKEKTGAPDAWTYTDYTNRDLEAQVNSVKKYIEDQFYSKDEFNYVLERLEKRAKEYFETDFSKHISMLSKRSIESNYYIKVNDEYIINEKLNNEYKVLIILKKEKVQLLYEKLIRELSKKYNPPFQNHMNEVTKNPKIFDEHFKPLEINEIINLYFRRFRWLVVLIRQGIIFDPSDTANWLESYIRRKDTCFVTMNKLCEQIERSLLNNTTEHNERLFNVIMIKMKEIEKILFDEEFITHCNKFSTNRICLTKKYFHEEMSSEDMQLIGDALKFETPDIFYGTVETFYNETLGIFNEGKNRINDLFSVRKLNASETTATNLMLSKDLPAISKSQPKKDSITPDAEKPILKPEEKIPLPVIAIKYQYLRLAGEHEGINEKNREAISQKYNWKSKTSGKQLHDDFKKFHTENERITPPILQDEPGYLLSRNRRINYLKKVVHLLVKYPKALEIANKELEKASK